MANAPAQKIKVGILGATGMVGQRFVQVLADHPWFEIAGLGASERSAGKPFSVAAKAWKLDTPIPKAIRDMVVMECKAKNFAHCRLVFSGLDSSVAGEVESEMAQAGLGVFSNSKNHRLDPLVPLIVPTVNSDHLDIVRVQQAQRNLGTGFIVTEPNCASVGMCVPLKVLHQHWGLEAVMVTTMQAISGAGYPGVASMDILGNVIPFISGEEEKLEREPLKILGVCGAEGFQDISVKISAHCNRVAVVDGHTECVSVKLSKPASVEEIKQALSAYQSEPQTLGVPSAPAQCILVMDELDRPQPRLDSMTGNGFTVSVGRIRPDPVLDFKLTILSHNTLIGAAGGAVLSAELAVAKGLVNDK